MQVAALFSKQNNSVPTEDVGTHLLAELGSRKGWPTVGNTEFDLRIELDSLSSLHIDALGLHGVGAICMHVKLPSLVCDGLHRPSTGFSVVDIWGSHSQLGRGGAPDKVLHQITKLCEAFYAAYWPCRTQQDTLSFLVRLYRYIKAKIPKLGQYCVVCGCKQKHTGLRPVPCKSKACKFAFEEHGIGADLKDLYNRPVVTDLLITLARAASQCTSRRDSLFQSLPSNFLEKEREGNAKQSRQQIDWHSMQIALAGIPAIEEMAEQSDLQSFFLGRSNCAKNRESEFTLLRSLLNSCQGLLRELKPADRFHTMETEYQFRLCMDSPLKEAKFSRLKKKHGSEFLFHGSPICNWHCILRQGLKNLSCTSMMSHGNGLGSGIYLAECSSTPAYYCYNSQTSAHVSSSRFGATPMCIALCEVIKHSANFRSKFWGDGVKVVPDSNRVITRYLFIYSRLIPGIMASSLTKTCERHAKTQEDNLERVKRVFEHL